MRYLLGLFLFFVCIITYADQTPPAFEADPSLPTPEVNIAPAQQNTTPASPQSKAQWEAYNAPIRECVIGDTIIPTKNNKIMGFLFSNDADTDATMSITGAKRGHCQVSITEGSLVKYCQFSPKTLKNFMDNLLNSDLFDSQSPLAQELAGSCKDNKVE